MSTVAERVAELTAKAKRRGMTIKPPPRIAPDAPPNLTKRLPPSKLDAVMDRPLPTAGNRSKGQLRVAAWLVCKALGGSWKKRIHEREYSDVVYLVHSSGMELSFSYCWRDDHRFSISLQNYDRSGDVNSSITVAANRSPRAIAGDIQRRILDTGAAAACQSLKDSNRSRRAGEVKERLAMVAIARFCGHRQISTRQHIRSGHPETNEMRVAGEASVTASYGYGFHGQGEIELQITLDDLDLAEAIINTIHRHRS